jgi:regulator of sirC expression with transglutaminase-like and TPR domain
MEIKLNAEYKSLISLLDDPDEFIYENVFNKIVEFGPQIIPFLEQEWEHNIDELVQLRLENIVHTLQFYEVKANLKTWLLNEPTNLFNFLQVLNKYQFPDIDSKKISNEVDELKRMIWLEMNANLTPLEQMKLFNTMFFKFAKFGANITHENAPNFSYLSYILETKQGNPMGLALLYLIVAQELRMPIYGVCLKDYFLLCYLDSEIWQRDPSQMNAQDILFYINPFNNGTLFKREEIINYLIKIKAPSKNQYFFPANTIEIAKEFIQLLISQYNQNNEEEKAIEMKELLQIFL